LQLEGLKNIHLWKNMFPVLSNSAATLSPFAVETMRWFLVSVAQLCTTQTKLTGRICCHSA